jgi:putative transposase
MQSVKGIKIQFLIEEGNLELLLKRYSKAVNLFLEKIFLERTSSLSGLNKFRKEIYTKTKLTGFSSVLAMRSALGIYKSWRRNKRKELPKVRAKFINLQPNYNCKLVDNRRLRITFEKRKYIWLKLKIGEYQQTFLDLIKQNKLKLGQITIGKDFVVLSVKKDYLPYQYQGLLALDINEKSIDGVVFKNNELKPIKWDLSEIYNLNQKYFGHKRKLQIKYPNRFALWKKLPHNKNYRNRVRWYLDNVSKQITDFAKKEKLMVVMENLKNIKKGINKRKLKLNKYNNKKQKMRTKSLSLLGRLNKANFRRSQFLIDYKGRWNNVPMQYINPKNTSKSCSKCGEIGTLNNSTFTCEKCGLIIDRHLNASINILKLGMASCGSGSRLLKVEDFKNQISEVALTKIA